MMMNYSEKKSQDILYINFIFGGCHYVNPYPIIKQLTLNYDMISPTTTFTDEELALKLLKSSRGRRRRDEMEAFIEEHGHKNFY